MKRKRKLSRRDLDPDPIRMFESWYRRAVAAGAAQPDAMTLATATRGGLPSARIVALRGVGERGFVFYTDRRSRKGRELKRNRRAALVFHWGELGRQVRISGHVEPLPENDSSRYFASRPRRSRIAAWTSRQGKEIIDRRELESRFRAFLEKYRGAAIPSPPHWTGYRLVPGTIEYWQRHLDRLHDRFLYKRKRGASSRRAGWSIARLSP